MLCTPIGNKELRSARVTSHCYARNDAINFTDSVFNLTKIATGGRRWRHYCPSVRSLSELFGTVRGNGLALAQGQQASQGRVNALSRVSRSYSAD